MPSKFIGFDVIKILENGTQQPQAAVTVNVYNVTDSTSAGTLVTDSFGYIPTQEISVAAGKRLRFSVSGYTDTIERVTAAEAVFDNVNELNLVLDDERTIEAEAAKSVDVYQKDEEGNPIFIGQANVGTTFKMPYLPTDKPTEFFLIPKNDKGISFVTSLREAPTITVTPNLETLIPDFAQNGAALNALINFTASNFTTNSKFRKIQWADDAAFTVNVDSFVQGNNTTSIGAGFSIEREGSLTGTKTIYVRIAHSSNNLIFGEWSSVKSFTFADSGGSGGSGGGAPPSDLSGTVHFGGVARLRWTNNGGTSLNQIHHNGLLIDSVSSMTDEYDVSLNYGYNAFTIVNDDGSSNTWDYWYYGGEF